MWVNVGVCACMGVGVGGLFKIVKTGARKYYSDKFSRRENFAIQQNFCISWGFIFLVLPFPISFKGNLIFRIFSHF